MAVAGGAGGAVSADLAQAIAASPARKVLMIGLPAMMPAATGIEMRMRAMN